MSVNNVHLQEYTRAVWKRSVCVCSLSNSSKNTVKKSLTPIASREKETQSNVETKMMELLRMEVYRAVRTGINID
jgi:hypothetical protein